MHLAIIFTAVPSIGRLLVELQPAVNAFAITSLHGARRTVKEQGVIADEWALSSFAGKWQRDYVEDHRLGVETTVISVKGKGRATERSEDAINLTEGGIQRSWDFRMS